MLVQALQATAAAQPFRSATALRLLLELRYAQMEGERLLPSLRGEQALDYLLARCERLFSVHTSAQLVRQLDCIASGERTLAEVLDEVAREIILPCLEHPKTED